MDRMITALFDKRHDAEQARGDLAARDLSRGEIDILTKDELQGRPGAPEEVKRVSGAYHGGDERGFWGSVKDFFMPLTDYWRFLLGLAIIVMVLAFPRGIVGTLEALLAGRVRPERVGALREAAP